jgi:uncharacterized protein YhjY with autotransporter beta-barrel domain
MPQTPALPTPPWGRHPFVLFLLLVTLLSGGGSAQAEMPDLPDAFDLRDVDGRAYIGPVKNQDPMGTCYAFGAVAAAESTYNRSMGLFDERAVRFSESFIIWSLSPYYEGFGPYSGANYDYDELQALVDYGLPTEEAFPYATSQPGDLRWDADRVRFGSWHRIPANDIETMKRVIQTFGAIDAAVYVDDAFAYHGDGVFSNAYTSPMTTVEYHTTTNHAISLVGWDDNADGEGRGAWILRNSWGPSWGTDGYMLIDYTSAAVATSGTYLVYGDWTGEDFRLENTTDITAIIENSGHQPVARGIYEWGGNHAFIGNIADIRSEAAVDSGSPYVHGIFLWAGDDSAVANDGVVAAKASTADGQATAYGICMQGRDVGNTGEVGAFAGSSSGGRATAYGVRQFGFDGNAAFDNSGSILAEALTGSGWAYGYFGNRLGSVVNSGQIVANATNLAVGLLAEDTITVVNSGGITAEAGDGSAFGILIQGAALTNDGHLGAVGAKNARGMHGTDGSVFSNAGTVSAFSESDRAVGVELWGSTLHNTEAGVISAETDSGTAYGLVANQGSVVVNNGHVIGDSVISSGSTLGGGGRFTGDVWNRSGVVAPGNSIGVITIDGDYRQDAGGRLVLEFGRGLHDALDISGGAYLDGALQVNLVDYQGGGTYSVLSSNGLEGEFATLVAPAVLNTELSESSSGLDLILTRNAYAFLAVGSGQRSVGAALDRFRAAATGDMGAVLLGVDNMGLDALRGALTDMAPGIHAATRRALVDLSHRETEVLLGRLEERAFRMPTACSNATQDAGQWAFWGSVSAAAGGRESGGVVPGLDTQTSNLLLGAERNGGRLTTGVTVALLEHVMDGDSDANRAEVTSVRGHVHSLWRRDAGEDGPYVAFSLGGARSRIVTTRDVAFLGVTADARHWAHDVGLGLGAGHVFSSQGWRFQPHVRLAGLYLHEDAINEGNAGPMNLDIASEDVFSLHSSLGLRVGRLIPLGGALLFPEARIQWTHALASDGERVRARFDGYDPGFAVDSDFTRDRLLLGAGLTLEAKGLTGGLKYEYSASDGGKAEEHQVALKMEFRF